MTMTTTLLQRIHALAESPALPIYSKAASIARKLASDDSAADKAHAITGIVKGLSDADADRLVAAVEALAKKP